MITLRGKYNIANVFIDEIDKSTTEQIYGFLNQPTFADTYIAIMPDCHAGKGAVVGFTMKMNEYVIPNVIGVDIGCGIDAVNLGKIDIDFSKLDEFIKNNIPSGFSIRNKYVDSVNALSEQSSDEIEDICNKTQQDIKRVYHSIGTLGGGNHFIEVDEAPNGDKWLCVHSGSRNFGNKIACYHQDKAKNVMKKFFIKDVPSGLEFLTDETGMLEYLEDIKIAQCYAKWNRAEIILDILKFLNIHSNGLDIVKSVHNYIDTDSGYIRKGAISAKEGEKIVIPLNMRDGVIIGTGKGNKAYNYSAPHGAGRILSRVKAKETLTMENFVKDMEGVYTSSIQASTLDESPRAYKDKQLIIDNIKDTVDIDFIMKPVYNFKDTTQDKQRKGKKCSTL